MLFMQTHVCTVRESNPPWKQTKKLSRVLVLFNIILGDYPIGLTLSVIMTTLQIYITLHP
jgi:hypothetical protein